MRFGDLPQLVLCFGQADPQRGLAMLAPLFEELQPHRRLARSGLAFKQVQMTLWQSAA